MKLLPNWRRVPLDHRLEPELKTQADPTGAGPKLVETLVSGHPAPVREALKGLEDRLFEEGVPRPENRLKLFFELIHPSIVAKRTIHGLPWTKNDLYCERGTCIGSSRAYPKGVQPESW